MIEFIVGLAFLTFLFWLGYHITGALLAAAVWLFIKLPFACVLWLLGCVCCVTILLIPLGLKCLKFGWRIIT